MSNAIQYGDVASPISVKVEGNDPESVTITVHNLGPAIPMETRKLIFQSWKRGGDAKHAPEQGTHLGLGLYIAKMIAEAHDGGISVISDEQAGTTFSVRLPRS